MNVRILRMIRANILVILQHGIGHEEVTRDEAALLHIDKKLGIGVYGSGNSTDELSHRVDKLFYAMLERRFPDWYTGYPAWRVEAYRHPVVKGVSC